MQNIVFSVLIYLMSYAVMAQSWQQFQGNTAHSGYSDGAIELNSICTKWICDPLKEKDVNSGITIDSFQIDTQPCVSADSATVFCVGKVAAVSGKVQLIAVNAATGQVLWQKELYAATNLSSISSPVFNDGYIYWIGSNSVPTAFLYKINAVTGTTKESDGGWVLELDHKQIVNASPLVVDNTIYFSSYATYGSLNSVHYAVDVESGSVKWSNGTAGGRGLGTMVYNVDNGWIYQSTNINNESNISAFHPDDGSIVLTTENTVNGLFQTGISYKNNRLHVSDYNFYGTAFTYSFDASTGVMVAKNASPGSGDSCPSIYTDGSFYACGDWQGTGKTRGFDADGNELWTFEKAGGWLKSPAIRDHYLFIGSQSGNDLYVLDLNNKGSVAATLSGSGPVAFGKISFYSIGHDGKLYAYSTNSGGTVTFSLSVTPENAGIVTCESHSHSTNRYQPETVTASPELGYQFSHWDISADKGWVYDKTAVETKAVFFEEAVLTAVFEKIASVKLSVTVGSGSGTVTPQAETEVEPGELITVEAIPSTGYYFQRWESGSEAVKDNLYSSVLNLTLYQATELTAHFKKSTPLVPGKKATPKMKLNINTALTKKNSLKLMNFPLDENIDLINEAANVTIGGKVLKELSFIEKKKNIYIYAVKDDESALELKLDVDNKLWQLNGKGGLANLAFLVAVDGIDIVLQMGSSYSGGRFAVEECCKWKYKGNTVDTTPYAVTRATGSYQKLDKTAGFEQTISISKATCLTNETFDESRDTIVLTIDKTMLTIAPGDSNLIKKKNGSYIYKNKETKTSFKLTPAKGIWSFKQLKQASDAPSASQSSSISISLLIGSRQSQFTLKPIIQKSCRTH